MKLCFELAHYGIGETELGYVVFRLIRNSRGEIISYVTLEFVKKDGFDKAKAFYTKRNQALLEEQKARYGTQSTTLNQEGQYEITD